MEDNIRRFPGRGKRGLTVSYIDVVMCFCVFALVVIGLVMIYSTSAYEANQQFNEASYYLKKQIFAVAVGIVAMIATIKIDYRIYGKFWFAILIVAAAFIVAIFTPLAYTANGATRWIKLFGISLQPAEVVKLAIIIYMTRYLSSNVDVDSWKGIFRSLVVPAIYAVAVLVFTSNLSSAIIIGAISFVMVYGRSKSYNKFFIIIGIMVAVAAIVVLSVKYEESLGWCFLPGYRGDRVRAWLNPAAYASDEGYQTLQSLYAIGSGGFWGKGIGESVQKLGFIPEAQNDMIFAIICEELGVVGASLVMVVFFVLISRCRFIAFRAKDIQGRLLAIGVMAHIAIQVILNIAVVTNTIPNTGISLPFISYGGTSIVFLMAEMGIVINVGKSINLE